MELTISNNLHMNVISASLQGGSSHWFLSVVCGSDTF